MADQPPVMPFPNLGSAPVSHTLEVPHPGAPIDALALPAAPAVVLLEGPDGRVVLIATTADARALVRKRLGLDGAPDDRKGWRVDYRALTARVSVIRVGSSLEAEAVYLAQARVSLPHAHRVVAERWRAWFVHVQPDAEFPEWTKTNLLGLVGARSAGIAKGTPGSAPGVLLGPIADKDSAGRYLEAVTDAFDLCRYHHLLVQAPCAGACAYKEMGRCPAPCDGSETMEGYRRRTREAAEMLGSGRVRANIDRLEQEMRDAAGAAEFERAERCRKQAQRLSLLDKPAFGQVRSLGTRRDLVVLPGCAAGAVTVALFAGGRLFRVAEVSAEDERGLVDAAARAVALPLGAWSVHDEETIDTIAVYSRWLLLASKRRVGVVIRIDDLGSTGMDALRRAARVVARRKSAEALVADQEVEGLV